MHLTITIKFISSQIEPNFLSPRLLAESDELINIAPPPRYSTISDSHMSTSSQGAESTPSANSLLSESGELEVPATGSSECKETPTSEAEWQARCVELELALQKFRDQAHNIRKLLRDKVRSIQLKQMILPKCKSRLRKWLVYFRNPLLHHPLSLVMTFCLKDAKKGSRKPR